MRLCRVVRRYPGDWPHEAGEVVQTEGWANVVELVELGYLEPVEEMEQGEAEVNAEVVIEQSNQPGRLLSRKDRKRFR